MFVDGLHVNKRIRPLQGFIAGLCASLVSALATASAASLAHRLGASECRLNPGESIVEEIEGFEAMVPQDIYAFAREELLPERLCVFYNSGRFGRVKGGVKRLLQRVRG